jgi:hypothetical protein
MNIPILDLVVYVSFTYGFCYLTTQEDGYNDIIKRFRGYFIKYKNIHAILTCPYCLGVFTSFLILLPNLVQNLSIQAIVNYPVISIAVYGLHVALTKLTYDVGGYYVDN